VVLPCNKNHYFHESCVYEWMKFQIICPMCRAEITQEAVDEANPQYKQIYHGAPAGPSAVEAV